VLRLPAGRELDRLVSLHCMGSLVMPDSTLADVWLEVHPETPNTPRELPRYSEDAGAAWQVVERLRDQGFEHRMAGMLDGEEASFRIVGDDDTAVFAVSRTAPHAICLAALKAVGYIGG
jgi:hypothetical protein